MSENNSGGLNDPQSSNMGSVGAGGVNSGSNSNQQGSSGSNSGTQSDKAAGTSNVTTNFNSQFSNQNTAGQSQPYGQVPFNVPSKDQTLQDSMYGPSTAQGPPSSSGNSGSSGSGSSYQPKPVSVPPKTITTVRPPIPRNKPPSPNFPATGPYPKPGIPAGSAQPPNYGPQGGPGNQYGYDPHDVPKNNQGGSAGGIGGQGGIPGGGDFGSPNFARGGRMRGYADGGRMAAPQRGPGGPKKMQNYSGSGPKKGGGGGGIVSANYVEAPGGAQVRPITGNRGLRHRQGIENQVKKMFGAKARPQAMRGYAGGGGASNLPQSGPGSPGSWGGGGSQSNYEPRYLTGSDASPSSYPRKPNPKYVPPRGTGGGEGGKGTWEPTGQGRDPGGTPRNDYF